MIMYTPQLNKPWARHFPVYWRSQNNKKKKNIFILAGFKMDSKISI